MTRGTKTYRGLTLDNVLHSQDEGDIHFNLYVPNNYRGTEEVASLVTLGVKPTSYFSAGGVDNQHGGGGFLFCRDPNIMGWLFGR